MADNFYAKYSTLGGGGGGSGTVTSVDLTAPNIFNVAGVPITTSGTIALTLANQTANRVFAGPATGVPAAPTFRALVAADIPALSYVSNVTASLPISSSGGATPNISITLANGSTDGYLSSTDWNTFNNKQPAGNYITALTGDATASGPGSAALTLATVNSNVGSFGAADTVGSFTVNGKGLVTAASGISIQIAESQVTGLTTDLGNKANIELDNLGSTAINADLIFNKNAAAVYTKDEAGETTNLILASGSNSGTTGNSGAWDAGSGYVTGINSGDTGATSLKSGNITNAGSDGETGSLNLFSGDNAGTGNSGSVNINSGNAGGDSGNIALTVGTGVARGTISLDASTILVIPTQSSGGFYTFTNSYSDPSWGSKKGLLASSNLALVTQSVSSGVNTTGLLTLLTGSNDDPTTDGDTGAIEIITGDILGTNSTAHETGTIYFYTGNNTGNGNAGGYEMVGGAAENGNSGGIRIESGGTSGSGDTGALTLTSGAAASTGDSGSIILTIGAAPGGAKGKIQLKNGSEGTTAQLWKSTDTSGSGSWGYLLNANVDANAAIALSKLATVTASRVLVSDASGFVSASSVTTTTLGYLDATSSIQTQLDAKIAKSLVTAKGDIIVATASGVVTNQAIGTNNFVLTADSAQTNGLKWAAPQASSVFAYRSVTTTDTVGVGDYTLDLSSTAFTSTLPTAAGNTGLTFEFVHNGSDFVQYTIATVSSQLIAGGGFSATTFVLSTNGERLVIQSTGSAWRILNHATNTAWIAYTPTYSGAFGTVATGSFWWKRVGDSIAIRGSGTAGTVVGATVVTISFPGSLSLDTAKIPGRQRQDLGRFWGKIGTAQGQLPSINRGAWPIMYDQTATVLQAAGFADLDDTASGTFWKAFTGADLLTTGEGFAVETDLIPISGWNP